MLFKSSLTWNEQDKKGRVEYALVRKPGVTVSSGLQLEHYVIHRLWKKIQKENPMLLAVFESKIYMKKSDLISLTW